MLAIYRASVENVRELKRQRNYLKRILNKSIKNKDRSAFYALTKLYALLFSSFAEVCFLKMVHTPYGFTECEISQILSQSNLESKWRKCLELAFQRTNNATNKGEIQNKKQILSRLIDQYIIQASQVRNKIAHGQWKIALNNENTAINQNTTERIENLDFVKTDIYFEVYEKISQAVEDLIESPYKAHFNFFYTHISELQTLVTETNNWTLESKVAKLNNKFLKQKRSTTISQEADV